MAPPLTATSLLIANVPGLLPGASVPFIVNGPPRTPPPPSLALLRTETAPVPVPLPVVLLTRSVPVLETTRAPPNPELSPRNVSTLLPGRLSVRAPMPLSAPMSELLPLVNVNVLGATTVIGLLEEVTELGLIVSVLPAIVSGLDPSTPASLIVARELIKDMVLLVPGLVNPPNVTRLVLAVVLVMVTSAL